MPRAEPVEGGGLASGKHISLGKRMRGITATKQFLSFKICMFVITDQCKKKTILGRK